MEKTLEQGLPLTSRVACLKTGVFSFYTLGVCWFFIACFCKSDYCVSLDFVLRSSGRYLNILQYV